MDYEEIYPTHDNSYDNACNWIINECYMNPAIFSVIADDSIYAEIVSKVKKFY